MPNTTNIFQDWTKKYSLSKTLRFELKPNPKTKPFLQQFVDLDIQRDKDYKKLKKIIDEYHKVFIEKALSQKSILQEKELKKAYDLSSKLKKTNQDSNTKKATQKDLKKVQDSLRKEVTKQFDKLSKELKNQAEAIKQIKKAKNKAKEKQETETNSVEDTEKQAKNPLFEKELITELGPHWLNSLSYQEVQNKTGFQEQIKAHKEEKELLTKGYSSQTRDNGLSKEKAVINEQDFLSWRKDSLSIVEKFNKFITYLTGFHENRKNIYSDKDQVTAVAHRIIHENLPKFFFNLHIYQKISKNALDLQKKLITLTDSLKEEFDYFGIKNIADLFELDIFNKCLTHEGIDNYNTIIGGKVFKGGKKTLGINEQINLYRQKTEKIEGQSQIPVMQSLYKQILSDRESHSFLPESFETPQELCGAIKQFWKHISEPLENKKENLIEKLEELLKNMSESKNDLNHIYFSQNKLGDLSNKIFSDWAVMRNALSDYAESHFKTKKAREGFLDKDFFSFQELHSALVHYKNSALTEEEKGAEKLEKGQDEEWQEISQKIKSDSNNILLYFQNLVEPFKTTLKKEGKHEKLFTKKASIFKTMQSFYTEAEKVLKLNLPDKNQQFQPKDIKVIKNFLDSALEFFNLIKPLYLEKNRKKLMDMERDTGFYNDFESFYEELESIIPLYNKTRNYITKNKKLDQKIKINFEDNTLLDGWDVNQELANLSVILRRKEKGQWLYYLGVMNKEKGKKLFDYHLNFDDDKGNKEKSIKQKQALREQILAKENAPHYEKMNYKFLPDPQRMLPKVIFSKKHQAYFSTSEDILRIKNKKTYAKNNGENFNLKDCHKLIDFYKKSINKHYDWRQFNFVFSNTNQYKDMSDFYHEVSVQGYQLSFDKIKESYIQEKINSGELFLFQIYNKDFSEHSTGKPNLHTEYFRLLFDQKNLEDIVFKLNGKAEIFYRKKSMEKKVPHPKDQFIKNKNPDNPKTESKFEYDIIKDRRFTEDKFFLHVPITLNFKENEPKSSPFNQKTLQFLKDNKNINIIGIDRGERHLAYYTVIDQKRNILEQGSFNTIVNQYEDKKQMPKYKTKYKETKQWISITTGYHKLLESKEIERDKSRKSWDKVENIKELKAGYLSHLVYQIAKLMINHNAIVVFEDLNTGFKRSREKFEKQVYQKLEKALIEKLNYLIFKDIKDIKQPGGFLKAYQLTAPFESFKKMSKQTGFLFYVYPHYTSKVCPLTGFVNLINQRYKNIKQSQTFFKNFESIIFNREKNFFVFKYSDGKVNPKKKSESKSAWTVSTYGEKRYRYDRKQKTHKPVNVTEELKKLFDEYSINYKDGHNLKTDIIQQTSATFFKSLGFLLNLTLQLRHINPKAEADNDKDFILSPVADSSGRFFDSRKAKENEPANADANGAYHIALKGLWTLQNIENKKDKPNIKFIKNKEWFNFIKKRTR